MGEGSKTVIRRVRAAGDALGEQVARIRQRVTELRQSVHHGPGPSAGVVLEAADDLDDALEELETIAGAVRGTSEEVFAERQRTDRELGRYRLLFEDAPTGYVITDQSGTVIDANRAARSMLGTDGGQDLIDRTFLALVADSDRRRATRMLGALIEEDDHLRIERGHLRFATRKGPPVSASVRACAVWGEQGIRQILWQLVDLSQLDDTRSEPVPAEERYRALVEQVPAISYVRRVGEDEGFIYISPQVETILGYTREEWTRSARLWVERIHPADRSRVLAEYARHVNDGDPFIAEYRLLDRDGEARWFRVEAILRRDEATGHLVSQGVALDVTERKRAQDLLDEFTEERTAALEQDRREIERLQRLDEVKSLFLQALSHELRKPLSAILGLVLTLERHDVDLPDAERRRIHERLQSNAVRSTRLLTDLLDLRGLMSGDVTVERSPTDLSSLARKVVADLEEAIDASRVDIRIEGGITASVEPTMIHRILDNLIVNAARHTSEGTSVRVRVEVLDGDLLLVVEDEGPGIPDDLKEQVFEPFGRGDTPAPGTGLGLAIVKEFAQLHGGRAWVEDRIGGGARFVVRLPTVDR